MQSANQLPHNSALVSRPLADLSQGSALEQLNQRLSRWVCVRHRPFRSLGNINKWQHLELAGLVAERLNSASVAALADLRNANGRCQCERSFLTRPLKVVNWSLAGWRVWTDHGPSRRSGRASRLHREALEICVEGVTMGTNRKHDRVYDG